MLPHTLLGPSHIAVVERIVALVERIAVGLMGRMAARNEREQASELLRHNANT